MAYVRSIIGQDSGIIQLYDPITQPNLIQAGIKKSGIYLIINPTATAIDNIPAFTNEEFIRFDEDINKWKITSNSSASGQIGAIVFGVVGSEADLNTQFPSSNYMIGSMATLYNEANKDLSLYQVLDNNGTNVWKRLNIFIENRLDALESQVYVKIIGFYDASTNDPDIITTTMQPMEARSISVAGEQFGIDFEVGDLIVRQLDDSGYFKIDNTELFYEDGDDIKLRTSKNIHLQDKGLKDDNIATAVLLSDIDNIELDTENKTILGGINEVLKKNILIKEGKNFDYDLQQQRDLYFASQPSIFADGQPANYDKNNQQGWYFKNLATPESPVLNKINWYWWADMQPFGSGERMTVGDLKSIYARLLIYSSTSTPWIAVYTKAQGDGQDATGWYRSLFEYQTKTSTINNNSEVLLYSKEEPFVDDIYKVKMNDGSGQGSREDTEEVLYITLQTNSGASADNVEFLCKELGFKRNDNYSNYILQSYSSSDKIKAENTATNYIPSSITVKGHLEGINTKLGTLQPTMTASNGIEKSLNNIQGIDATTSQKGVVMLSNLYNGDSELKGTTEKALNQGLATKLDKTLTNGKIFIGNDTDQATEVEISGEASIDNLGSITLNNQAVIDKTIDTFVSTTGEILSTDSISGAISKLDGNTKAKQDSLNITPDTTNSHKSIAINEAGDSFETRVNIPTFTTAERDALLNVPVGHIVYNSDETIQQRFNGSTWDNIKGDVDFSNLTTETKNSIMNLLIPDYTTQVAIVSGHICTYYCYLWIHGAHTGYKQHAYINGVLIGVQNSDVFGESHYAKKNVYAFCKPGDVITFTAAQYAVVFKLNGAI